MIILTQEEALKTLNKHGYKFTAQLLEWAVETGVKELGSATINGKYAVGLSEIRDLMLKEFRITMNAIDFHKALEAMGDPDTYFYFGGKQHFSNAQSEGISVYEYLLYLSTAVHKLSNIARHDLEKITEQLVKSLTRMV
ncbi:hypothetical protein GW943_00820 [Candidatus Parcubacteria bacterium]|uniref:Uncharacterized protein n=1 Tax=Candidatus Kaiserbacteria bacterium CG10_big_fil_rev_8_21_14_0_10_47_16 TaxID=1974608 RepID=A0A2H0UDE9_9BACT|nr:hypothetical protein [Candidatus Parcubacteria bacterium]PIR84380.1 MAG: hypothetical protein COU16_02200 [Candidatus Kaiserbacteria bacterium CG10_big_fil_rev_8_21_14_0_10_47_16]